MSWNQLHSLAQSPVEAVLENQPFLTPCIEIRKANLYEVSTRAILGRFSNTAAVEVWWQPSFDWPPAPGTNVTRSRNASAVSDAPHQKSTGRLGTSRGAHPIQLFEGSRPWVGSYAN